MGFLQTDARPIAHQTIGTILGVALMGLMASIATFLAARSAYMTGQPLYRSVVIGAVIFVLISLGFVLFGAGLRLLRRRAQSGGTVEISVQEKYDAINARFAGKVQELKDESKLKDAALNDLETARAEISRLKEREKRHSWLHNMAERQAREISHYVQLEEPYPYDERLANPIPSIGFKFPVRNYSVLPISIDETIRGRICFEGRELADPVIVKHCGEGIQYRQLDGLAIEQRLTRTEADHILATPDGVFDFQFLEITIKSGSDYPIIEHPLRITHEHALHGIKSYLKTKSEIGENSE
jgi:hypothetical protein